MTASVSKHKTKALAGWFGAARTIAEHVGEALRGCKWVGVPFAGGMSELLHINASTILVNDLHRHIVNLARIVANDELRPKLIKDLGRMPVHCDVLEECQRFCKEVPDPWDNYKAAVAYFVCCWMGRGGNAGKEDEFEGGLSYRWMTGGGDSAVRFRSATESLAAWDDIMPRCTFICVCAFEFLEEAQKRDRSESGLYLDPPWPDDGDGYKHKFSETDHRRLAAMLAEFKETRVVIRYGDHPLIRELYPESKWSWQEISGRTQANNAKAEVLITRRAS